ncbi:MAG: hypothetical protein LBS78_02015 [Endomicrobium sp.]|jgi:hypothetical protein|nr:hypothetical protein [Endomicrobium sp.]
MSKKVLIILSYLILVVTLASLSYASRTSVIDTPRLEMLNCGSYNAELRFSSSKGDLISKVEFGILKSLNLGLSWEWSNFISNKQVGIAIPALQAKFRIYEGSMVMPGLAVGYDGQGYFFDSKSGKYLQKSKGIYFIIGREIFSEGVMLNVGANIKLFSSSKIYGFVNAIAPLHKENIFFMMEYDNIHSFADARFNLGLKLILKKHLNIDCILRDCLKNGSNCDKYRCSGETIFRIAYSAEL